MIRILALAGGLAGAVALSQFPEFSQQYMQRLAGAVDELRGVVLAFDRTASGVGLTRQEALARMTGDDFQDGLRATMAGSIARYERLGADLAVLQGRGALERLSHPLSFADMDLARRTWADFRPAVPVTGDGLICAGIGFAGGWLGIGLIAGLMGRAARRLRGSLA